MNQEAFTAADPLPAAIRKSRAQRRETAWAALTTDQQALVREAAVMGFVLCHRYNRHELDDRFTDQWILATVLDACADMDHLYPHIAALMHGTTQATDSQTATPNGETMTNLTVTGLIAQLTKIQAAGGGDRIIVAAKDDEENGYNLIDTVETVLSEPYPRENGDIYDEDPDDQDDDGEPSDEAVPAILLK